MVSQKLVELLKEISASEAKIILHLAKKNSDKRYKLLSTLVQKRNLVYESFIQLFKDESRKVYKSQNDAQLNHTIRRLSDFFCQEVEKIVFGETLNANKVAALSLGRHFRMQGNLFLSEYYFEKSYQIAREQKSAIDILATLPNLISLNYLKSSKGSFKKGLALNEELNTTIESYYYTVKVDYYNNISNLYLDNNTLGNKSSTELIAEIEQIARQVKQPEIQIGFRISQMRLSFGTDRFSFYSKLTQSIFDKNGISSEREFMLRKYLFFKLVLGFYSGGDVDELIDTAEQIRIINRKSAFVDSYTQFYLIVMLIIKGDKNQALKALKSEPNCFKQNTAYLKEFIDALTLFVDGDFGKAKRRFNKTVGIEDYFIDQFSRLCLLAIYHQQADNIMFSSILRSTERQIKMNPEKVVVHSSSKQFLEYCKAKEKKSRMQITLPKNICVLHNFLLIKYW